jgi:hypothetical protein
MNVHYDAERIDRYIDALLADPNAPPPPGLDSETAAMVCALVNTERAALPPNVSDVQARVWLRTLAAARAGLASNGRQGEHPPALSSNPTYALEDIDMNRTQALARHPRTRLPSITAMAALTAAVLFCALLLAMNASKEPGAGGNLPAAPFGDETPTALPPTTMSLEDMFANAAPLALGETVAGTLGVGGPAQAYTFDAEEDMVVHILMESDDMDALILSLGASFTDADSGIGGSGSGGGPATQSSFLALQSGGKALIAVSTWDGQPHTFTLRAEAADFTHVDYGEVAQGELAGDAAYHLYAFEGEAGDIIDVRVEGGEVDTRLSLLGRAGGVMMADEDGGARYNPEILDFQLYANMTHYLLVEPSEAGQAGAFTVTVEKVDHQPIHSPESTFEVTDHRMLIELGEVVPGTLSAEMPTASYELTVGEATTVAAFVYSEDFLPGLSYMIMAENGGGGGGGGGGSSDPMPAYGGVVEFYDVPAGNTLVITVGADYGVLGDFTLIAQPLDIFPVVEYGETVEIELAPLTLFAFEAEAGDVVDVSVDGGDLDTYARLLNPWGWPVTEDDDSGTGLDPEMLDVYLTDTGTYYVQVQGNDNDASGTVTLSVTLSDEPDMPPADVGTGSGGGGGPAPTETPTQ